MINIEDYDEIVKCSKNEEYFINKYIKSIKEFNSSEKLLEADDKDVVIGFLLHKAIFNSYKNIAIINNNSKERKEFINSILKTYESLPELLYKPKIRCLNESKIIFENDSKIFSVLNSSYCLKGFSIDVLVLNNIKDDKIYWEMIYPSMYYNKDSKTIKISL